MKKIVINHDAENVAEAIGCDIDGMSSRLADMVREFMTNDKYTKRSHLIELIKDEFNEADILFLASQTVFEILDEMQEDIKKFAMFKSLLSSED